MKKKQQAMPGFVKTLFLPIVAILMFITVKAPAEAAVTAPEKVTGVKQIGGSSKEVRLKWDPVEDADGYMIAMSKEPFSGYETVIEEWMPGEGDEDYDYDDFTDFSEKCWISDYDYEDMEAGSTYYVKICAYKEYEDEDDIDIIRIKGEESQPLEVVTLPSAPAFLKHTKSTESSISLSWGRAPGADIYKIIYNKAGSSIIQKQETKDTKITLKELAKNGEYHICVLAGRQTSNGYKLYGTHEWDIREWGPDEDDFLDGNSHEYDVQEEILPDDLGCDDEWEACNWRGWINVPVTPQKITSIKALYDSQNTGRVRITTNARYSADGYEYELWTASGGQSKKVKSFTKKGYQNKKIISDSNFKKNVFYKLRVRAYCQNRKGGKWYSKWSDYTYISKYPEVNKSYQQTSNGLKIKWNKIGGANRYLVYVSTKPNGKYNKFASTKKNTINITKCGKNKLKHGKVYYFYIVAQKKAGEKYYDSSISKYWYCTYF